MARGSNRFTCPVKKYGAGLSPDKGLSVIILGAAPHDNMSSYGNVYLLPMPGGNSILQNNINTILTTFKHTEIILTVGFEADKVIKKIERQVRLVENQLYQTTGPAEELRLAINNSVYNNMLVISSDIIFDEKAVKGMTANNSSVLIDDQERLKVQEVGTTIVEDEVTIFHYGVREHKWCHISFLTGKELELAHSIVSDPACKNKHIHEILNEVLMKGGKFEAHIPTDFNINKINSYKDIK